MGERAGGPPGKWSGLSLENPNLTSLNSFSAVGVLVGPGEGVPTEHGVPLAPQGPAWGVARVEQCQGGGQHFLYDVDSPKPTGSLAKEGGDAEELGEGALLAPGATNGWLLTTRGCLAPMGEGPACSPLLLGHSTSPTSPGASEWCKTHMAKGK